MVFGSLDLTFFIERPLPRAVVSKHSAEYNAYGSVYVEAYIYSKRKWNAAGKVLRRCCFWGPSLSKYENKKGVKKILDASQHHKKTTYRKPIW